MFLGVHVLFKHMLRSLLSQNDILIIEWHQVVLETPFAGAFVSDIYI